MTLKELDNLVQVWKSAYPDEETNILVLKGPNTEKAEGLSGDTWTYEYHEGEHYLTFILSP